MSKKKLAGFLAGVLGLTAIAGSFAFFYNQSSIENNLFTKEYGSTTIEKFTPDTEWEPGVTVDKTVAAMNTGDYDLIIRVKMTESWVRDEDEIFTSDSSKEGFLATTAGEDGIYTTDTSIADASIVGKLLSGVTSGDWIDGGDGYYYYKSNLSAGETSTKLMESITLSSDADMGTYDSIVSYSTATDITDASTDEDYGWTTTKPADISTITYQKSDVVLKAGEEGYASAGYTLTVITESCQASQDALDAEFGGGAAFTAPAGTSWTLN